MFTETEMHDLFERVLGKMLVAGWLSSFTFTKGKGWWRNWTPLGVRKIHEVAFICATYELNAGDGAPMAFYVAAKGERLTGAPEATADDRAAMILFAQLADEIQVSGEDELLVLVQIALWD